MFRLRPACTCVYVLLMLLASCQHPTRKQSSVPAESLIPEETNRIASPDLQPFFQGNQLYLAQHFDVPAGRKKVVMAEGGLKVTVDPSCLEHEDGSQPAGDIHVRIVELQSSHDLFLHNAASVSDGRLLVSGGSYYIGMSEGGRDLRVRRGYAIETVFPRFTTDDMELFYGERDSLTDMNWKRAGQYLRKDISQETVSFEDPLPEYNWNRRSEVKILKPAFNKRVFRTLDEPVFYYNRRMTIGDLIDTVNARKTVLCLDSISFWPKNLPKDVTLDTHFLVHTYGPRFQYIVNHCECREDSVKSPGNETVVEKERIFTESVPNGDTLPVRKRIAEQLMEYYAPVGIKTLGWINADRFYKLTQPVDMQFDLPITFQRSKISYFILFKGFSGMLKGDAIPDDAGILRLMPLPKGEDIRLIAFIKKGGQVYQSVSDHETGKSMKPVLNFKEISTSELNRIFGKNIRT